MAYPLFLTVRPVPAPEDIPALRELLEKSFPHADNIPYLDALSASPLPSVTAQRLGALSLLPSLLAEAGIVPEDLILRRDSHGRPYCKAADGSLPFCGLVGAPAPFDFNLSHTDTHVAAALLVGDGRVGVDMEEPIPPPRALPLIRRFYNLGFNIEATVGTAEFLKKNGINTRILKKISEDSEEIFDALRQGHIAYVINTSDISSHGSANDGSVIRKFATENNVTIFTALDTVRVLLDVLEETTLTISTIDA